MFNKFALDWAFYTKDTNSNFTLVSTKNCKRPTTTKNFKEVKKLLQSKTVQGAGCMLLINFPKINLAVSI